MLEEKIELIKLSNREGTRGEGNKATALKAHLPTSTIIIQQVVQSDQHVASSNVGRCCSKMLNPFGRASLHVVPQYPHADVVIVIVFCFCYCCCCCRIFARHSPLPA